MNGLKTKDEVFNGSEYIPNREMLWKNSGKAGYIGR
jgi:hypothetical protein